MFSWVPVMSDFRYDDEPVSEDEAIENVLGEHPRAKELRLMRSALEQRLAALERDLAHASRDDEAARMRARIAETIKQIRVLRDEEAITEFVEGSVRATLNQPSPDDLD